MARLRWPLIEPARPDRPPTIRRWARRKNPSAGSIDSAVNAKIAAVYLHNPVAQVTRPVRVLAGFARVTLPPGGACRVVFRLHADRTAFHGLSGTRIVEPGLIGLAIGSSSGDLRLHGEVELTGPERRAGADRVLTTPVSVTALGDG